MDNSFKPFSAVASAIEAKNGLLLSSAKDTDLIEQKHHQIVNGAGELFFKKGYHRTTIREIAVASGMSMGQLYHYISSKDDVLFLTYRHMQMIWYDYLLQSGLEDIKDAKKRLSEAIRYTLEFMIDNKDLILFIYTEIKYLEKKYLRVVLEMDDKNVVGFWRGLLKNADVKLPNGGDIDFLSNFISYLMVFLPLRGWNLKEKPNQDHMDFLTNFIMSGLGVNH